MGFLLTFFTFIASFFCCKTCIERCSDNDYEYSNSYSYLALNSADLSDSTYSNDSNKSNNSNDSNHSNNNDLPTYTQTFHNQDLNNPPRYESI